MNTQSNKEAHADKILGIELLRFASAIAVLIFHFQHFAFVGTEQVGFTRDAQPFYPFLKLFYEFGFYGVQVFWCISGFIFFWKYADTIANDKITGKAFFMLRLSRLYPLHFATLIFIAITQIIYNSIVHADYVYAYNDAYHFGLQLIMASNWGFQAGDSFNGPIWSISIEVLVYLLFFVGLRLLSASALGLAALLISAGAVIALKLSSHPFFYCVMFFYMGCFTALASNKARDSVLWTRLLTAASVAVVLIMPVVVARTALRPLDFLIVFSPALIFLCVRYVHPGELGTRLLTDAGNITYASYLLHVPLQISICILLAKFGFDVPWKNGVFFAAYMVVTILLSHWCYRHFEMPMQSWMRKKLLKK